MRTTHVRWGWQHCQMWGDGLGAGYARPGPSSSPLFQWYMLHSTFNAFEQVLLTAGQRDPHGDWVVFLYSEVQSYLPTFVEHPITNSNRGLLSQVWWDLCAQHHSTWPMLKDGTMTVSCDSIPLRGWVFGQRRPVWYKKKQSLLLILQRY